MNTTHKKNTTGLIRKWFTRGVACMALLFAVGSAQAVDTTTSAWNGGTTVWGTAGNWGSGLPSATASALFNGTFSNQPQLGANTEAQGLYLANSVAQNVTIIGLSSARILTITGTATLGGQANAGIMLDDTANRTLTINNLVTTKLFNNTGFYVNNSGTLSLNGSGSLDMNLKVLILGGTGVSGNIVIAQATAANAGSLIINTAGIVTLSAQNGHTGGTTLTAGTLNINHAKALGAVGSTFTINDGTTIDNTSTAAIVNGVANPITINGNFAFTGGSGTTHDLSLGTGAVALGGATRTITANAGTLTLGGIISNGGLIKDGAGTLTLSGANTYTSTTTVKAGVLRLSGATSLPGGIGATGGTSALTLTGGVVEMAQGNFARDLGTGVAQVQLTGGVSGFSAKGAARTVNFNNDAHQITWGSSTFAPSTLVLNETTADNTLDFKNAINLGASLLTVAVNTNVATMSGILSGSGGGLTKTGSGTLTLTGSNTFTGNIYIKAGTLADQLGGNNGDTRNWGAPTATIYLGDATVGADATLATQCNAGYNGPASSINPIIVVSGGGARTIRVLPNVSAQAWIGGDITLNNNLQFIYDRASANVLKISGNITGTGNLTFASTMGTALISLTGVSINPVGVITNSSQGTGALTISGAIGTNVTAVVQNSATSQMILTSTNTYNGPTTINAGTMFVNGTNTVASGTGTYTVNNGGTLAGKGKIDVSEVNGNVVVEAGGKLSPGSAANTVGTSTLALGATGTLDISAAVGTPGTLVFDLATTNASDLITLTSGKLNIGIGALSLASLQIGGILDASQTTYTLVHTVDGITGTMMGGGTSVSGTLPGSSVGAILSISEDGKDLVLNLTSFPPPKAVTWKGNIFSQWENVTTNWVVTGTSTPTNFMYSDTVTFDDSGSATATITSIAPVTPGSVIVSNSVNAYTISAAIAGSGSLTKLGTNTLTLGVANSFTGGLYINNGTVGAPISTAGAFGGSGTGRVYLNADLNASATLSVPGNATTANPITVQGAGTNIILAASSQAPSSSGAITLYNNLYLNNIGAASGSQLTLSGSITGTGNIIFAIANKTGGNIALSGPSINPVGAINNSINSSLPCGTANISGAIGANVTAVVQNSTSSKLILSGTNNTYAGTTAVSLGTLETQKTNSLGVASSLVIADGAKMYLNFTGTNTITSLKLGNVNMPKGIYGTNAPLDNLIFSGLGMLKVLTGPANGTFIRFY
jgi:autotransporter-associated beta strand protein